MARKRTEYEFRSVGGEQVERDLKKIGAAGQDSGEKVKKGSQEASKGLKAVDATVSRVKGNFRGLANELGPVGAGLSKLGAAGLAAAGATVAAGGLVALTVRAAETADALAKQARAVGINVEALQEWTFVAEQSGISADAFSSGLGKLGKRIGDISTVGRGPLVNFLKEYDTELLKSLRDTARFEDQLLLVADAANELAEAGDATGLRSFLDAFFSESGRDFGLVFSQGREEIEAMMARLRELGGVISEDATANAEDLRDTINELSRSIAGNLNNALLNLAPAIDSIAESMADAIPGFVQWVESFQALENRSLGSLAREAAELRQRIKDLEESKLPAILLAKQLKDAREELEAVNAALATAVDERAKQIKQDEEQARILADFRDEQQKAAAAAAARAKAEKEQAAAAKKFSADRVKAAQDIAQLERAANQAGLQGEALLAAKRDEAILQQFQLYEDGERLAEEFAAARLAIEDKFQADVTALRKKEADKQAAEQEKAAEKAAEEFTRPFKNAAENVQRAFGDTFTDIYRNGITRFEDLTDVIRDIMARLAGEITAMLIFRPQLAGGVGGIFGSLGIGGAQAGTGGAAGAGTGAAAGSLGGFLAGGSTGGMATSIGIAIGAGFLGTLGGNAFSNAIGLNASRSGNIGGALGATAGGFAFGPLGAFAGGFAGSTIGNLFGGSGNDKQKLEFFNSGVGDGVPSPFGDIVLTRSSNLDGQAIVKNLAQLDRTLAQLLSPEQTQRVQQSLAGTSQFFSANSFDNEAFDVVKTRLVRIIDAVAENTVASGLLDTIGRDPGNIDTLVSTASEIIGLINTFQDEGQDLNQAEQAIRALNEQFDELSKTATQLGFTTQQVEQRREQTLAQLTQDADQEIADRILSLTDPFAFAIQNLDREFDIIRDNVETLGGDLLAVERAYFLEREKLTKQFSGTALDSFASANDSIRDFLSGLDTSEAGGLSISQRAINQRGQFDDLLSAARTDPGARSDLAQFLPGFVDLQRQALGGGRLFADFRSFLDSSLRNLVDQSDTVSTLNDVGEAITAGDNAIVSTLRTEVGKLNQEIKDLRQDINLLMSAQVA